MRVTVKSSLGDLAHDAETIARKVEPQMVTVVRNNILSGTKTMQSIARRASGPHGSAYWKRISGEAHGLSGEFGPHDGGLPVGAGWRHGHNNDTARAADIVGPRLQRDAGRVIDRLFEQFWA